jgi:hypothetical protein
MVLVGRPQGKRPLGRSRRRWKDNIKMELEEAGWGGMGWIDLAEDSGRCRALVHAGMNLRVQYNAINLLTIIGNIGYSRRAVLHGVSWLPTRISVGVSWLIFIGCPS